MGTGFIVDLPGCTSYGDMLSEARKNAHDALISTSMEFGDAMFIL